MAASTRKPAAKASRTRNNKVPELRITIRTPPNVGHDLVGGIDNNGGIRTGLDSGELTVPFFIHLLLDQFRGEGLGNQTVGIGLSLGFDQFSFGVDLSSFFFLVGFCDSNFFFFFGIDVGGLLLDLCQLQILLSVDLFLDGGTGFVIGVDIDQRNGFNDDAVRLELILEVGGEFRVERSTTVLFIEKTPYFLFVN